jgi:hypothetical protein
MESGVDSQGALEPNKLNHFAGHIVALRLQQ